LRDIGMLIASSLASARGTRATADTVIRGITDTILPIPPWRARGDCVAADEALTPDSMG